MLPSGCSWEACKLARDRSAGSDGIGELLLAAAHRSIVAATRTVAVRFVIVDAIDNNAKDDYEHFGDRPMPDNPHHLYRRIKDIAAERISQFRPARADKK